MKLQILRPLMVQLGEQQERRSENQRLDIRREDPDSGNRLNATAARLISRLAFDKSVALSLIQSRSSDLVSGRDPSPAASPTVSERGWVHRAALAGIAVTARGWRIGSRRRRTTAVGQLAAVARRTGIGEGSRRNRSRSSASAEISAAAAPRTSAAAAMSLACGPDDCGAVFEDSASVISASSAPFRHVQILRLDHRSKA